MPAHALKYLPTREHAIVQRALLTSFAISTFVLPLVALRAWNLGTPGDFWIAAGIYVALFVLVLLRDAISTRALFAAVFLVSTLSVHLTLIRLGLLAGGAHVIGIPIVIMAAFFPKRALILGAALLYVPILVLVGLAATGVYVPAPADPLAYATSPAAWLTKAGMIALTTAVVFSIVRMSRNALIEQKEAFRLAIYDSMASVATLRDYETGMHLRRCSLYAEAMLSGLDKFRVPVPRVLRRDLPAAVRLHDVGKVGISDTILLKPGPLTADEFHDMKAHTILGRDLIARFQQENGLQDDSTLNLAREIAATHHENWDGSGYPRQLSGPGIPLAGRIMALIDVYDALRSDRPYKSGLGHAETLELMARMNGVKFDPALYAIFEAQGYWFHRIFEENRDRPGARWGNQRRSINLLARTA